MTIDPRHAGAALPQAERHALIASLYRDGVPVAEIAGRVQVCAKTVRNVARRAGLPPRQGPQPERDAAILGRYRAGDRIATIAAVHQVNGSRVRVVAARAGVPPRVNWQRRYPIDEHAFDDPSSVGWWLLGLLAADGSINAAENRVSLCQTLEDADVLRTFYAYVGCPDRPLTLLKLSEAARQRQLPRRPAAEARIFSKRIVVALGCHGVVPRKTASLELSPEAARRTAVWLGLLDGDGSVGIYRNGRMPRVNFFGTERLMRQCEAFWRATLGFSGPQPAARPHGRSLWRFSLCSVKARAAAEKLLAASPVSMCRKRVLLTEIAQWKPGEALCPRPTGTIVSGERRH